MDATCCELSVHLPRDLALLAVHYFAAVKRDAHSVGMAGEVVRAVSKAYIRGAGRGGHVGILRRARLPSAKTWDNVFVEACGAGNAAVALVAHAHGARKLNGGLQAACKGGHKSMINLTLKLGADANTGLLCACSHRDVDLVKLMVARGATNVAETKHYFERVITEHS